MNSDITPGEGSRLIPSADGQWLSFLAPKDGAYQLWRISTADGALEQLTDGRHYLSSFDQVEPRAGRPRTAVIRSVGTELADVWVRDGLKGDLRRVTSFNDAAHGRRRARRAAGAPRHGRWSRHPGLVHPGSSTGRREEGPRLPLVTQIHGGPHTLYGWSPFLEFQILAAVRDRRLLLEPARLRGLRPRVQRGEPPRLGSGPMRDVLAGVDSLVADGLADPDRLGLTGRLVRRLPDELDHRPRPALRRGDDLPIGQRHGDAVPDR